MSGQNSLGPSQGQAEMKRPESYADIKSLKMNALRALCKQFSIPVTGRVTRQDVLELVCNFFSLSTSGAIASGSSASCSEEKRVREAYRRLPSFTRITSGWSVEGLCKLPHFDIDAVKDYLLFSRDKDYDGESLRCYKQLRAYQLFDEGHVFDVEMNLWEGGTEFYFVRAKCRPSQDTSSPPHKCIVCIDRSEARCYGAYCRCVSGQGEACSHVAALLFALEDFSVRGLQRLRGPAVTEKLCKWCKPCAQKVEPVPLSSLVLEKAAPGERKRKRWVREGISKYDPRDPKDRVIDKAALRELKMDLQEAVGDCGFLRHLYDLSDVQPAVDQTHSGHSSLPDTVDQDSPVLLPAAEVVCKTELENAVEEGLLGKARQKLFLLLDADVIADTEHVSRSLLDECYAKVISGLKVNKDERAQLEEQTRGQGDNAKWHAEHCGRITASCIHRVVVRRPTTEPDKLVADIMQYKKEKPLRLHDPRSHGHTMEPEARRAYEDLHSCSELSVTECGMFVDPELGFLGASPDGIVEEESSHSRGVLEIKCPMSALAIETLASQN